MASIKLKGDTSGELTIQAPSVAGTNTLNLPASSGTLATTAQASIGMKNRIINGNMAIDQRNAGASVTPNTLSYPVDRIFGYASVTGKFSCQQNSGSVTPPAGFVNYLGAVSLSTYSVGAGEQYIFGQPIEGLNVGDLGWGTADAKTVTLSFWVRSSLTGTFGGSLQNSAFDRSYPFSYTISVANTWEKKTITITGDTTGTWLTTNGVGIRLGFSLGAGVTMSGTAGAWAAANYVSATGATSVVGTSGATFYITGVQLETGTTATDFENLQYTTQLQLCQRYYYRVNKESILSKVMSTGGAYYSTTACYVTVPFLVSMRSLPSLTTGTVASLSIFSNGTGRACSAIVLGNTTLELALLNCTTSAATGGNAGWLESNSGTNSYLEFNSEL
jgi:hypothetical protein